MNKSKELKEYYAGVNVGFWNTKAALLTGGEGIRTTCFLSLRGPQYSGHLNQDKVSQNLMGFSYGNTARDLTGTTPQHELSRSIIETDLYQDYIRAAFNELGIEDGCIIHACFSLPYEWMKSTSTLSNVLRNMDTSFTLTTGETISWQWGDLLVLPEDFGFVMNEAYTLKGELEKPELLENTVICGIGGHTSGIGRMIDSVDVPGECKTFPKAGMWSIAKELHKSLTERFGEGEISEVEAAKALEDGFIYYNGRVDLVEEIAYLHRVLYADTIHNFKGVVDFSKIPSMCICGGGGQTLYEYFKSDYAARSQVWIPSSPIIGAAVGQAKLIKFGEF